MRHLLILLTIAALSTGCKHDSNFKINPSSIPDNFKFLEPVSRIMYNDTENIISCTGSVQADKVEYYLDNEYLTFGYPPDYKIYVQTLGQLPGGHSLKLKAYKDEMIIGQDSTTVIFQLRLGEKYRGGRIFYFTEQGFHGLIAAEEDFSYDNNYNFSWTNSVEGIIGTTQNDGMVNTQLMTKGANDPVYAAYHFKGSTEWYIPSRVELAILRERDTLVGGFSDHPTLSRYWSSTEMEYPNAYGLNFAVPDDSSFSRVGYHLRVRAIKRF